MFLNRRIEEANEGKACGCNESPPEAVNAIMAYNKECIL